MLLISWGTQLQQHSKCSLGRSIYACSQHIKCQRFQNSSVLHNLSYRIMSFVINLYVCNYVCNYDNYNRHVRFCNWPNQRGALALQRNASKQAKKKCTTIPLTGKANNQSCTLAAMRMSFNTSLTISLGFVPGSHLRIFLSNLAGVSSGNTLHALTLGCVSVLNNL